MTRWTPIDTVVLALLTLALAVTRDLWLLAAIPLYPWCVYLGARVGRWCR